MFYNATIPCEAGEHLFHSRAYANAILYVPEESIDVMRSTQPWCKFENIQAFDFTGGVHPTVGNDLPIIGVYNLHGYKVGEDFQNLPAGIYVVKHPASSEKVVIR